jgi:hypothetical protein
MSTLSQASDGELFVGLHSLVNAQRVQMADIIEHLGELDARRAYLDRGFPSLYQYCLERLRFSEDEAWRRIDAARIAREFPTAHAFLRDGRITLTVLTMLKPHLTMENHVALLDSVANKTSRLAKEWLAAQFPRPDVPASLWRVPVRGSLPDSTATTLPFLAHAATAPASSASEHRASESAASNRARVEPLSEDRFLLKVTVSRSVRDELEKARSLMRHQNPSGDTEAILARALRELTARLEKEKLGGAERPATPRPAKRECVTNAVRREVIARDGLGCAFVSDDGQRCDCTDFLEFDHVEPKGRGNASGAENVRLLCRAHNLREAERVYGKAFMARALRDAREGQGATETR